MNYVLYTDGGSRGNPGPSACAYIFGKKTPDGLEIIDHYAWTIDYATNNIAEYQALYRALMNIRDKLETREPGKLLLSHIDVYMDSELIINQLNGTYRVKNDQLLQLFKMVRDVIENKCPHIFFGFHHVRREDNALADRMVNCVLDGRDWRIDVAHEPRVATLVPLGGWQGTTGQSKTVPVQEPELNPVTEEVLNPVKTIPVQETKVPSKEELLPDCELTDEFNMGDLKHWLNKVVEQAQALRAKDPGDMRAAGRIEVAGRTLYLIRHWQKTFETNLNRVIRESLIDPDLLDRAPF